MKKTIGLIASSAIVLAAMAYFFNREASVENLIDQPYLSGLNDASTATRILSDTRSPDIGQDISSKTEAESDVDYADTVAYVDKLNDVTRQWREKRGYHLSEDFLGYRGPEYYTGTHPHGYLNEEELKALSEKGDPDAQVLYAYYYLKLRDTEATIDLYKEVVINTEQTAPLGSIAATKIYLHEKKLADNPGMLTEEQKTNEENEAYAYFQLMKNRMDPMADMYFQTIGYSDFSDERRAEIEILARELGDSLLASRTERGLPPYADEPLDLAGKLGVSEEELAIMQERYSATMEDEGFIEEYTEGHVNTYAYDDQGPPGESWVERTQADVNESTFDMDSLRELEPVKK